MVHTRGIQLVPELLLLLSLHTRCTHIRHMKVFESKKMLLFFEEKIQHFESSNLSTLFTFIWILCGQIVHERGIERVPELFVLASHHENKSV